MLYNGFPSIGKFWSCGYISFHPFDFLSRWKMDLLFHCVASDFYCADWDGLCDHLRDVLWENSLSFSLNLVLLLLLRIVVGEFKLELMYIFLSGNIRSPFFICMFFSCFFCSHSSWKSSESKVKFRQAINICKRVLEAAELAYANKTKASIFSQKLGSVKFSNY